MANPRTLNGYEPDKIANRYQLRGRDREITGKFSKNKLDQHKPENEQNGEDNGEQVKIFIYKRFNRTTKFVNEGGNDKKPGASADK